MHNKKKCECPDCEEFIEPDSPCSYLCIMCDTNGCTREKGQTPRPTEEEYRAAAKRIRPKDGDIEIDSNANVSFSEDGGAYVQAWVWVYDSDVNRLPKKTKG